MWQSIGACLYLINLIIQTEGITYLKGVTTPKWTTRKIPLEKWLEDNNWRLAPYGNQEFTKIFRQYKHVIRNKYYEEVNITDSSLGRYVKSLFLTSTLPTSRKLLKKDKIKMGKLKLVKQNLDELEQKLGLTTEPPPTTTEPTTELYTGPSTRKTTACSFDPDYFFDQNWPLKQFKRLKRDVSDTSFDRKVSLHNNDRQNFAKKNSLAVSNAAIIFPSGDVKRQVHQSQNKLWIRTKRNEFGMRNWNTDLLNANERKLIRFKRELNSIMFGDCQSHDEKYLENIAHLRVKRDLGSIVRRSTKRPHLSRKFKSQSMKRFRQDSRLASMLTRMQANITIIPELIHFKQVMDDCVKYNLSTLFYVLDNVAYFGSVPPHLLQTKKVETSTKPKPVTFELGATQVLGANIFDNNKKVREPGQKVSPGDVEIPNFNVEEELKQEPILKSMKNEGISEITESLLSKTTKLKRGRKKKMEDVNENSNSTKKTRAKRKSTTPTIDNSLENSPLSSEDLDTNNSRKNKPKKRQARSIKTESQNLLMDVLPSFLYFVHNNVHLRRKRNADTFDEKTKKIENQPEKKNIGHFGKLKEHIKRSKDNIVSYVKEKKEALVDMPRRARFIAREMYLDGKFFFQELKEVPDRMKKDYEEKKEMFGLVWDMMKIFMPATEVGEKGGTTPEPKVVEDPKQYVKDYVTPDLSEPVARTKRDMAEENPTLEDITEILSTSTFRTKTTEELTTSTFKTVAMSTEIKTVFVETERRSTAKTQTSTLRTSTERTSASSTPRYKKDLTSKYANEPILVTDDPSTKKVYQTRVVGPDYIPTHTRLNDNKAETTRNPFQKTFEEKINDEKTFDRISKTMKDKKFMDDLIKNADTDRLHQVMENLNPADMFKKMDEKTVNKMGKLMSELDADTIRNMQNLAMKSYNLVRTTNPNKIANNR